MEANPYGVSFLETYSFEAVNFLDLVRYKENGRLLTRTSFKDVNRNHIGELPSPQMVRGYTQKPDVKGEKEL